MANLPTDVVFQLEDKLRKSVQESITELLSDFDAEFKVGKFVVQLYDWSELQTRFAKDSSACGAFVILPFTGTLSGSIMMGLDHASIDQIPIIYNLDSTDPDFIFMKIDAIMEFGNVFLNRVSGNISNQFSASMKFSEVRFESNQYHNLITKFSANSEGETLWTSFEFKLPNQKIQGKMMMLLQLPISLEMLSKSNGEAA